MDPLTILTALLPAATDGIRGLIGRFTKGAGAKPQNIKEVIQLQSADLDRLRALADLDRPTGATSLWVANLRASARYITVFLIFGYGMGVSFFEVDEIAINNAQQLMASAFFFLFGDRVYLHLKGR